MERTSLQDAGKPKSGSKSEAKPKKSGKSGKKVSARTLTLAGLFLALVAVVGYLYTRGDSEPIIDPSGETILAPDGTRVPVPPPVDEIDPATLPPGSQEVPRMG